MGVGLVAMPALASTESLAHPDTQIRLALTFWKPTGSGLSIPWEPISSISCTLSQGQSGQMLHRAVTPSGACPVVPSSFFSLSSFPRRKVWGAPVGLGAALGWWVSGDRS